MASDSHKDEHLLEPSNSNQNDSSDAQLSQSLNEENSKSAASDVDEEGSKAEEGDKVNSPQPLEASSTDMSTGMFPQCTVHCHVMKKHRHVKSLA